MYQTATFSHPGIGESTGYNYTRESNPTRAELEQIISSMEGAADTVAWLCGWSASRKMQSELRNGSEIMRKYGRFFMWDYRIIRDMK
ncbi:MAG: PLP-dependent transferase [Candidatus Choladocola sp.]|nr:PLP-dependent transferase [Candidatus Choladocola sp.]